MHLLKSLGISKNHSCACIGGEAWLKTEGATLESLNPATAKPIISITQATSADLEKILEASSEAQQAWSQVPAPQRGEVVRRIGQRLREQKDLLGSLVSLEMGKSKVEGDGEVQEMIDMADFAVGQSRMLYGKTIQSERVQHRLYEHWLPLGIVSVMTAFNFPVAVWAWNAFLAAICGNVVIWRPSSQVPLTAIAVQHICNDVLNEMGYRAIFSLFIASDHKVAEPLIDDTRVKLVSFTGSCHTGRQVNERVAKRLGKCLLELGGNNAVIVDASANLKLAIPAIVFGAIGTAGQRCTTTRRLFLHNSIYDRVIEILINAYKQIKVGDPLDKHNHMGPLINQQAVNHYQSALQQLQQQGGQVLFGGHVIDQPGFYVEPTIVTAENAWPIVQQETFAPILYVMRYASLASAIEMQNSVPQGLSSALLSQDLRHCELFLSSNGSDCGIAGINVGTSGAEIGGAFGGEKDTGGGREAGSDAWKSYMRRQTVTINWSDHLPLAQGIQFNFDGP